MAKKSLIPTTRLGWIDFEIQNLRSKINERGIDLNKRIDKLEKDYLDFISRSEKKIANLEEKKNDKKVN